MVSKSVFLEDLKDLLSTNQNLNMEMDLLDIDGWDSFSAILFISMIDNKYHIKIDPFNVAEAIFVEDLYNIVVKK